MLEGFLGEGRGVGRIFGEVRGVGKIFRGR